VVEENWFKMAKISNFYTDFPENVGQDGPYPG
jgi:hypothetical protein